MNKIWVIIGTVVIGGMIYGIHKNRELDYLEHKKIKDYTLGDILTIGFVLLLIIGLIRCIVYLFY